MPVTRAPLSEGAFYNGPSNRSASRLGVFARDLPAIQLIAEDGSDFAAPTVWIRKFTVLDALHRFVELLQYRSAPG